MSRPGVYDIRSQLVADEGRLLRAARDPKYPTLWNIGIGHCLGDHVPLRFVNGITDQECEAIYSADMNHVVHLLDVYESWWRTLASPARTGVLLNAGFNLGVPGLSHFDTFLGLVRAQRWQDAADDLRTTHAYQQLHNRYERLAVQISTGTWQ